MFYEVLPLVVYPMEVSVLKETRNSLKLKWPSNLGWISKKTVMEVGNIIKPATFKCFLHLSYKNT